ncbi:hypothetical protein CPB86DRAFT_717233 [Serendipita vermifera]|nr:hypothetical protein CPB86DRAFT_717233 [Serendipita vermifera]
MPAAFPFTNSVPWSSRGSLHSLSSGTPEKVTNGALQLMADPNLPPSASASVWGDGHTVTSFGMETEIIENDDIDEDLVQAIDAVQVAHTRKVTHYKRLLEQAQTSSASQLHAQQAELKLLRVTLDNERSKVHQTELARDRDRLSQAIHTNTHTNEDLSANLASVLGGDGKGGFKETEVRRVIRSLGMADRMRLIGIILDCCLPGDISEQIRLLEKYRASTFDIIGSLPQKVALLILQYLTVPQLLNVETVSKKWQELVHNPTLWRYHCLVLTATDPVPLRPPAELKDWETLYRSLHHRESNWRYGVPQHLRFLNGHTKFCTTLSLKGKRLISGSYDETIRFWDMETGQEKKCLSVNKAVSCLDFLAEEEVFAVGYHDIGRVHLFSSVTYNPLQQVSGHLYGIRAVALSPKHLISAGADKALVCWNWRSGEKIVRFGQQTNMNIGVQILRSSYGNGSDELGERFVSVTIDGVVRVFSIKRREMISQFNLAHLGAGDPVLSAKIAGIGSNANNMLQWFAADGNQMTCATKSTILHLEWMEDNEPTQSPNGLTMSALSSPTSSNGPQTPTTLNSPATRSKNTAALKSSGGSSNAIPTPQTPATKRPPPTPRLSLPASGIPRTPSMTSVAPKASPRTPTAHPSPLSLSVGRKGSSNLTPPPVIIAVLDTPDIAVGAVDPRKRRVVTATRFSTRAGADRRIFVTTHKDESPPPLTEEPVDGIVDESEVATPNGLETDPVFLAHSRRSSVSTVKSSQTGTSAQTGTTRPPTKLAASMDLEPLGGVWEALAVHDDQDPDAASNLASVEGVTGNFPAQFKGLATPALNPMSFALSHEEVVVGCADGTIYVMSFVGYKYAHQKVQDDTEDRSETPHVSDAVEDESTPPASALDERSHDSIPISD